MSANFNASPNMLANSAFTMCIVSAQSEGGWVSLNNLRSKELHGKAQIR